MSTGYDVLVNYLYLPRDYLSGTTNVRPLSTLKLLLVLLSIRLYNALSIKTFFQADEYWQALEPAHYLVYGYGYLTWEWNAGIRSFLHPLFYAFVYQICMKLHLDYDYILNLPKVLSALFSATGELYLYKLAQKNSNGNEMIARLVLFLSVLSSFNWFCFTRSFSNSLELTLTTIALYFIPMHKFNTRNFTFSMIIAGLSCIIRPTNGIIWAYLGLKLLFINTNKRLMICSLAFAAGVLVLGADAILNYWFYGYWNPAILKFIEFNVTKKLSAFYGISRIDFYFFQALPILLLTYVPFFVYGFCKTTRNTDFKIVILLYLFAFSMIQHKEFRFIYPLMPILLIFTADGSISIFKKLTAKTAKLIVSVIVIINFFLAFYFTIHHESGAIKVTELLRSKVLESTSDSPVEIGFLTPCHSTPFQSHFHLDPSQATIWFLTCEPPLNSEKFDDISEYMDESDEFYDDPHRFISDNFPPLTENTRVSTAAQIISGKYQHSWPDYLVIFEHLEKSIQELLDGSKYVEVDRLFNSRFHWDHRRTGDVIIYEYITE
ncbi:glycosyltransferase family 22 protein [[Candida] arabinofermentans NRRL YB-2248]|uniref:Mannosyltransferase n=1 Tax=[Candida] arabinofermentans NRRL YB-2248 TaxID=983967 RepID=A0A1E4T9A7_9ASCO|nr:glycosyltransferase family 22 protein [[Candida] arabinofermentans NRRL YB-2248]